MESQTNLCDSIKIVFSDSDDISIEDFDLTDIQRSYLAGREGVPGSGSETTNIYFEVGIDKLDINRLRDAWAQIHARHESLGLRFINGKQVYSGHENTSPSIDELDISHLAEDEIKYTILQHRKGLQSMRFDEINGPVYSISVLVLPDEHYKVRICFDMLIVDLSSVILLFRDFGLVYQGKTEELEAYQQENTYKNYVRELADVKKKRIYQRSKAYWLSKLDTFPTAPKLPYKESVKSGKVNEFKNRIFYLERDHWDKLKQNAKSIGVSPTMFVGTAFFQIIADWSKEKRFSINMTTLNRKAISDSFSNVVGDFTSNILLEVDIDKTLDFSQNVIDINRQFLRDCKYRNYTGVEFIRDILNAKGSFDSATMPVVLTSALRYTKELDERQAWESDSCLATANLDYMSTQTCQVLFDHQLYEINGNLKVVWDTVDDMFPTGTIDQMLECYRELLNHLVTEKWQERFLIDSLPQSQRKGRQQVNATKREQNPYCLHELFTRQAYRTPGKIGLSFGNMNISYASLERWSARLAKTLIDLGVQRNHLVGVRMIKGWEQIIAVLGILRSGAAYMPVEASQPETRQKELIASGKCQIIVEQDFLSRIEEGLDHVHVIQINEDILEKMPEAKLVVEHSIEDIAYVIFTSGSTGKPKGVVIDHRGAVNTVVDINQRFKVTEDGKAIAISSLSFDLSVYDIFGMLAVGGSIVMPSDEQRTNLAEWCDIVKKHRVNIWNTVPALMQLFVDHCIKENDEAIEQLKLVMMSGDWIPVSLPDKIAERNPICKTYSLGGATEASIWSIYHPIDYPTGELKSIPYGKPLGNQFFRILDQHLSDCPDHVIGDLYIGGIGVAKGYWSDTERTQASFIRDREGNTLYKTGDLAKYCEDGSIEFVGREDNQVKIQGYRVELGEIEQKIRQLDKAKDAIVLARGDTEDSKSLIAYIIRDEVVSEDDLTKLSAEQRGLYILKQKSIKDYGIDCVRYSFGQLENTEASVLSVLQELKQHTLDGHPLPKYLYPSGSALYPVQIFVELRQNLGCAEKGSYYYSPKEDAIVRLSDDFIIGKTSPKENIVIHFIADMAAMSPIYEGDLAKELVVLECGYIDAILSSKLKSEDVWYETPSKVESAWLSEDSLLMGSKSLPNKGFELAAVESNLSVGNILARQSFRQFTNSSLDLDGLKKSIEALGLDRGDRLMLWSRNVKGLANEALYQLAFDGELQLQHFKLVNEQVLLDYIGESNHEILKNGNFMLFFTREKQQDSAQQSLLRAGALGQVLMSQCWKQEIGVCPISGVNKVLDSVIFSDHIHFVHAFIGGGISEEQMRIRAPFVHQLKSEEQRVIESLKAVLPEYMVPRAIIFLDKFPLTPTGKLDRKRLPEPGTENETIELASTETERYIVSLWREEIETEKIGADSNFFQVGGNSLLAIRMLSSINKKYATKITIRNVFENSRVRDIASFIDKAAKQAKDFELSMDSAKTSKGIFKATKAQENIYASFSLADVSTAYNILFYIDIFSDSVEAKIKSSLAKLIDRHEALRTKLHIDNGELMLRVSGYTDNLIDIKYTSVKDMRYVDALTKRYLSESFDLESEYPFKVSLLSVKGQATRVVCIVHHIVADYLSAEILKSDLVRLLESEIRGEEHQLPAITGNFSSYASSQNDFFNTDEGKRQLEYWCSRLEQLPQLTNWQAFGGSGDRFAIGGWEKYAIDTSIYGALKKLSKERQLSVFMIGVTALNLVVRYLTNQKDIVIGTPITVRDNEQHKNLVGMLLNTLPLRIPVNQLDSTLAEMLLVVKKECLEAFENGDIPYELVESELKKRFSHSEIYNVRFVYRNMAASQETGGNIFSSDVTMDKSEAKFDILFTLNEIGRNELSGDIEYNSSKISKNNALLMNILFAKCLELIAKDTECTLENLVIEFDVVKDQQSSKSRKRVKEKKMNALKVISGQ